MAASGGSWSNGTFVAARSTSGAADARPTYAQVLQTASAKLDTLAPKDRAAFQRVAGTLPTPSASYGASMESLGRVGGRSHKVSTAMARRWEQAGLVSRIGNEWRMTRQGENAFEYLRTRG